MKAKYISESMGFERGKDPKISLGLGFLGKLDLNAKEMGFVDYVPKDDRFLDTFPPHHKFVKGWMYRNPPFDKTRILIVLSKDEEFIIYFRTKMTGLRKYEFNIKDWEDLKTWDDFLGYGFSW